MYKIEIINLIKNRIIQEYTIENISKYSLKEFEVYILDLFEFIYNFKDTHKLSYLDFRDFLDKFYYNLDIKDIKIENRFELLLEELALYYAHEPYLWDSSFIEFKNKVIKDLNSGIY